MWVVEKNRRRHGKTNKPFRRLSMELLKSLSIPPRMVLRRRFAIIVFHVQCSHTWWTLVHECGADWIYCPPQQSQQCQQCTVVLAVRCSIGCCGAAVLLACCPLRVYAVLDGSQAVVGVSTGTRFWSLAYRFTHSVTCSRF